MDGHTKNPVFALCGILMLLPCILFYSCNSEEVPNVTHDGSEIICFDIASGKKARSVDGDCDNGYITDTLVLRSEDSSDTLCVQTIVTDGICVPYSDKKRSFSRGTPVEKDNFYEKFHVLAYWKQNGTLIDQFFYMDEDVTDQGGNEWSSIKEYYWPGDGNTLKFYAWAPIVNDDGTNSSVFTSVPSSPADTKIAYEVPGNVAEQQDILVATTGDMESCDKVPLTFQHICAAVRFEAGSEMQPGSITKVSFKGVHYSGSYDMETLTWALDDGKKDFSLGMNSVMTGAEPEGTEITPSPYIFMMLPQALPAGATLEVVFHDDIMNQDYTMTASIAGQVWKMGTTVTYKVKINKNYELEFVSEPEIQDAHYVIYPIKIKASEIPGGWTVTSMDSKVTLRTDLTDLEKLGYWIESDRGTQKISSSAVGEITIYAFLEENVTDATRDVTLELRPAKTPDAKPQTFTVSQLCPAWNGSLGCERIEDEKKYPWGFYWKNDFKLVYDMTGCSDSDRQNISSYIRWTQFLHQILPNWFPTDISYVDHEYEGGFFGVNSKTTTVTINFGELDTEKIAQYEDGLSNTKELYNFNGIAQVADIINQLQNCSGYKVTSSGTGMPNPENYAARTCAKLNKYSKKTDQGNDIAVLDDENFVWFLPSKTEFSLISDPDYGLIGEYWTSTADNQGNENAYKASSTGITSLELRYKTLSVRAVRRKP